MFGFRKHNDEFDLQPKGIEAYSVEDEVWILPSGPDQHTLQGFVKEVRDTCLLVQLGSGNVIVIHMDEASSLMKAIQ